MASVGEHPLVSRVLKGAFHERPPQPRYSETWDVSIFTRYIDSLGPNSEITLSDLTHKLTMLLALTRPSRSADLANLNLQFNNHLCPVNTLRTYEERTKKLRGEESRVFIAVIKPHKAVASCTIARWLNNILTKSGINTNIFKAHSVRSASVSTAANAGITTNDILKVADWSNATVFQKYYYKPERDPTFEKTVLSKLSTTKE